VTDEQASHTQGKGLRLEELRAQRTELLPERLEMARRRKRRRGLRTVALPCPDPSSPYYMPMPGDGCPAPPAP
jgi:hypothetical protein